MVERRLLYLVIFYVACVTLVSCDGDNSNHQASSPDRRGSQKSREAGGPNGEPEKQKRKRKRTTTAQPQTCAEVLTAENSDCLNNIPEGYEPDSCVFDINPDDCSWECCCTAIETEATTRPPLPTYSWISDSSSSEEEVQQPADCNLDRDLNFKNQFIDIKGFIKRFTFCADDAESGSYPE